MKVIEKFDQVDEEDHVIGVTDKAEAHSKGLIHRVGSVFIFDSIGDLFVQVHHEGGILDSTVGGHIRKGEGYEEGAKREMQEEVNLDVDLKKIGVFYSDETYAGVQYRHMYGLYSAIAPDNWVFEPNDEVSALVKMPVKELLIRMSTNPRDFTAGFLKCMEFYCQNNGIIFPLSLDQYKLDRLKEA